MNYNVIKYIRAIFSILGTISLRGLDLCGDPFPVIAESPVPSVMSECLYARSMPDASGAGSTEAAYVPNEMKA